ncbi:MAG: HEAT repeat domain-containing protein [Desulfuromonadaceae bacterium]|nr:HEAT repeat domain-containing protein [Desulfuromonadaceae bacterium]MDD2856949.1 HEAT repeat domain-containing protein [Desulfuromonadaceae bacterium]
MKEKARSRIEILRPLLKDPVPAVRTAAAEAIEKLEATISLSEILVALKTGNMGTRIGAIYALGEVGGETVLEPLAYCSKRHEVDIRSAAAAALGKLQLPGALSILLNLLEDDSPTVQTRAIASLRSFELTTDIFIKLRSFLNANDGQLEAEAALTLAGQKDLYSLPQILALLTSNHASTRQAAATALSLMPIQ